MKSCDQVQAALLDSLYDLLEPDQARDLETHLLACVACQQALTQTQAQQRLLATAALAEFPNVRFEAPAETALLTPLPARRGWLERSRNRWAAAAAVLLVLGGLGIWGGAGYRQQVATLAMQAERYQSARQSQREVAAGYERQQVSLDKAKSQAESDLTALKQRRMQTLQHLEQEILARPLHMQLTGPEKIEPGAANTYQIQVRDRQEQPVAARIETRVEDRSHHLVYHTSDVAQSGSYNLVLPRDLPLRPNADLSLVVRVQDEQGQHGEIQESVSLGAPLYVTHLTTDKPMYQPGETVYYRSLTLERFSLKPPRDDLHLIYELKKPNQGPELLAQGRAQVAGKDGKPLAWPDGKPIKGVGSGAYALAPDAPGGEYILTVREAEGRFQPQERRFLVNRYQPPQLNKELEFTKKSYGPGEEVVAACKVSRVADASVKVASQPVEAVATVDGKTLPPLHLKTDANGAVNVRFRLPAVIARGEATLAVTFQDRGGSPETLDRPIPIALKKLAVAFFPEGGDLIAGFPNRVYFQARATLDKPAELRGHIVDDRGQTVVPDVHTLNDATHPGANQAMGRFTFTPAAGRKYELKIDTPVGIEGKHPLPEVKTSGVVLSVPASVTGASEPIPATLCSADRGRTLLVGAYCRGRLMAHQTVMAKKGAQVKALLQPETGAGGVYRITVFEVQPTDAPRAHLVPMAERLVYRRPAHRLKLTVRPDRAAYAPGDHVKLKLMATNERGQAEPALVMVAVADKSVLKLADEKTFRTMPTHFLLTSEVRRPEDLEHVDFLLDNTPLAARAVDLLLGTQGWRRFAEQNPGEFRDKQPQDGNRLLVAMGQLTTSRQPKAFDFDKARILAVYADFDRQQRQLDAQLARKQDDIARLTAESQSHQAEFLDSAKRAYGAYRNALVQINRARYWFNRILVVGTLALTVMLLVAGVWGLLRAARLRRAPRAVPYLLGGALVLVLVWLAGGFSLALHRGPRLARVKDDLGQDLWIAEVGPAGGNAGAKAALSKHNAHIAIVPRGGLVVPLYKGGPKPSAPPPRAPLMANAATPMAVPNGAKAVAPPARADTAPKPAPGVNQKIGIVPKPAQRFAGRVPVKPLPAPATKAEGGKRMPVAPPPLAPARHQQAQAFNNPALERARLLRQPPVLPPPMRIREYAHVHPPSMHNIRQDFAETVYWNPVLILPDGSGQAGFDLDDSVTTFQVRLEANTVDGGLGATTADIEARKPLVLEPTVPIEVTAGDRIDLPVTVANNTASPRRIQVGFGSKNLASDGPLSGAHFTAVTLEPEGRARQLYRLQPTITQGQAVVDVFAGQGNLNDQVERTFKIVPDGFPMEGSQSDLLERTARVDVALPEKWLPGTLRFRVEAYPSTLADLQQGLEALLREPCGCFEQTSSSNYPNLLILNYLQNANQARPALAHRAKQLLAVGYQRLTSFECIDAHNNQKRGYEWFGGTAPPHEALTAYGLLEFRDLARVYDVDRTMLERTQTYLMSQRDGQGGFRRNPRALDTFGRAPQNITNAYIVWALTESGKEDVARELSALAEQARRSSDPYFLALTANSLLNRARTTDALAILKRLVTVQKPDGHLDATQISITGSGGRDLQIETTALATLAWLKDGRPDLFTKSTQAAIRWIGRQRGGQGGFGATQSTILALKAIIAYTKANKRTAEGGDLILYLGERELRRTHFTAEAQDAIVLDLPDAEKLLKPGTNALRIQITGKNVLPYTASWSYRTTQPASAADCPITLQTRLARTAIREAEAVRLTVRVENKSDRGQGMVVAIIGLPGGLTLPEDLKQLKDAARLRDNGRKAGLISAFEIRGRELVLYWRGMAPKQKVEVNLDLIGRVPGQYRGPASRAYRYYNADHKCWTPPLEIHIEPRDAAAPNDEKKTRGRS